MRLLFLESFESTNRGFAGHSILPRSADMMRGFSDGELLSGGGVWDSPYSIIYIRVQKDSVPSIYINHRLGQYDGTQNGQ